MTVVMRRMIRRVDFAFDSLIEELRHAGPRRGEWLPGRRPRACGVGKRGGDHGLAVDVDFEAVAAGGADAGGEEAVFVGQLFNCGDVDWDRR